jgi:hypothetical protein
VTQHAGATFLVVGVGARARRLIDKLAREVPNVMQVPSSGEEHVAMVNPYASGPLAWGHDSPGKAPVIESTTPKP